MYYLYVIKMWVEDTDQEYLKIGYSKDVTKRISQLKVSSPFLLTCSQAAGPFSLKTVKALEGRLHSLFYRERRFGEWFCVDSDKVLHKLGELTWEFDEGAKVASFRY